MIRNENCNDIFWANFLCEENWYQHVVTPGDSAGAPYDSQRKSMGRGSECQTYGVDLPWFYWPRPCPYLSDSAHEAVSCGVSAGTLSVSGPHDFEHGHLITCTLLLLGSRCQRDPRNGKPQAWGRVHVNSTVRAKDPWIISKISNSMTKLRAFGKS